MRFAVDSWDPGYGSSDGVAPPPEATDQQVDAAVEVGLGDWAPVPPRPVVALPSHLLVVDGVRRIDARLNVADGPSVVPGIAFSWACAAVLCCPGKEAQIRESTVRRGVFSTSAELADVVLPAPAGVVYRAHHVRESASEDPLVGAFQAQLALTEGLVAHETRRRLGVDDDLLLLDGPIHAPQENLERCLGYVKSHHKRYLQPEQEKVVGALGAGERTPVFLLTGRPRQLPRASWYLRLPGATASGLAVWGGVVRLECTVRDGDVGPALALAATTQVLLPALATVGHKDPRAPQQLVPVAGLERMLRQRLGDRRLLLRGIRAASATAA